MTQLLLAWGQGDEQAMAQLTTLVYDEVHRTARRYMAHERPGHTLQATALVNEAYLKLVDSSRTRWQNRAHFFAVAAQLMRRILVDFARSRGYQKRGGNLNRGTMDDALGLAPEPDAATLTAAVYLASYLPARQATRVDPAAALRRE